MISRAFHAALKFRSPSNSRAVGRLKLKLRGPHFWWSMVNPQSVTAAYHCCILRPRAHQKWPVHRRKSYQGWLCGHRFISKTTARPKLGTATQLSRSYFRIAASHLRLPNTDIDTPSRPLFDRLLHLVLLTSWTSCGGMRALCGGQSSWHQKQSFSSISNSILDQLTS